MHTSCTPLGASASSSMWRVPTSHAGSGDCPRAAAGWVNRSSPRREAADGANTEWRPPEEPDRTGDVGLYHISRMVVREPCPDSRLSVLVSPTRSAPPAGLLP